MARVAALLTPLLLSVACAKPPAPIGYTPSAASGRDDAPPTGGGGYDFGADLATVRAKCAASHGAFAQSGKVSTCTAHHPDIGATQITLVEYCKGAVCRVHSLVVVERPDAESWLVPFEYLRRQLRQRYGTPDQDQSQLPADCAERFSDCVRSGRASATQRWRWDDGHAVMLRLGATDQVPAAISVSYENASDSPTR